MRARRFIVTVALLLASAIAAHADTFDLDDVADMIGGLFRLSFLLFLLVLFMTANYILNFIFIGLAIMRLGNVEFRRLAWDLVLFTIGGQLADRVGATIARIVEGGDVFAPVSWTFFAVDFASSGVAIAILVLLFSHFRWRLSLKARVAVVALAVIFTNPAYIIYLLGGPHI